MASEDCYDKQPTENCKKWEAKGICNWTWVNENCAKTCKRCAEGVDCKDTKSADYCQEIYFSNGSAVNCHWPKAFWECRKSCNRCNDKPSCEAFEKNGLDWPDKCDCKEAPECLDWASFGWCTGWYLEKCPISCKAC